MRNLLKHLPQLPMSEALSLDGKAVDRCLLLALGADAESVIATINAGLGGIGHLLAHSAVVIEDGTISADSLESIGFLMAELGDLAAACLSLAASCRHAAARPGPAVAADMRNDVPAFG